MDLSFVLFVLSAFDFPRQRVNKRNLPVNAVLKLLDRQHA